MSVSEAEKQSLGSLPETIQLALRTGRLPHGILLVGPRESKVSETAMALAKALLCQKLVEFQACGDCLQCRQVDKGMHPDLTRLVPGEDSAVIKIEPVRELIAKTFLRSMMGRGKVFIIEPAEALNETAQNALLKTLEEPEGDSYFILVSYAPRELLPTIRSRTQTFRLESQASSAWADEQYAPYTEQVIQYLFPGSMERTTPDLSGLERTETLSVLEGAIHFLRDVLVLQTAGPDLAQKVENRYLKEKASSVYSSEALIEKIELLAEFKDKIRSNVNLKLALSVLWTNII